jgi:hypothetical protein
MVEWNNEVINWNLGRSYIPKNKNPPPPPPPPPPNPLWWVPFRYAPPLSPLNDE